VEVYSRILLASGAWSPGLTGKLTSTNEQDSVPSATLEVRRSDSVTLYLQPPQSRFMRGRSSSQKVEALYGEAIQAQRNNPWMHVFVVQFLRGYRTYGRLEAVHISLAEVCAVQLACRSFGRRPPPDLISSGLLKPDVPDAY
jgi:hypothetical protein